MSSFTRDDYTHLFLLARRLYVFNSNRAFVRETATELMAMAEYACGQQPGWPRLSSRYVPFAHYPTKTRKFAKLKQ